MNAPRCNRRHLLASTALLVLVDTPSHSRVIRGALPWSPNEAYPPERVLPGVWRFFNADEAAAIGDMAQRLIPADGASPGGGDAGCALFLDRQLVGPFGDSTWLYMQGPFAVGTPQQGLQSPITPAVRYRTGLAAIATHCRANFAGRTFPALTGAEQDALLSDMEAGTSGIADFEDKPFFEMLLANVMEGYFADPVFGGNRDMAGWKLVGFPGVRYDYRDVLARPNEAYAGLPVGLTGRPAWDRS
jgi:gluconate 2-dehydrogenase gamma chain